MTTKSGFRVQAKMCSTCIFRPDNPLDLEQLLQDVADPYGGFKTHRVCHHSNDACCAGFWARHKDDFQLGQLAQRLDAVILVNDDTLREVLDDKPAE